MGEIEINWCNLGESDKITVLFFDKLKLIGATWEKVMLTLKLSCLLGVYIREDNEDEWEQTRRCKVENYQEKSK